MSARTNRLLLPALKAHMGDWVYYLTRLTMRDITDRVSFAQELHESRSLNDLIQRELMSVSTLFDGAAVTEIDGRMLLGAGAVAGSRRTFIALAPSRTTSDQSSG